ncbi:MAG: POTRA domain-containing protein [Candidatus Acidiferrales bacterium]
MGICLLGGLLLAALPATPLQLSFASYPRTAGSLFVQRIVPQAPLPQLDGIIETIQFVGLRRVSPETLRAHVTSRVGELLDQARIERDVRVLVALGWFDSVAVELVPLDSDDLGESSPLRLVFTVKERPYLSHVEFHGSHLLSQERIKQVLKEKKISMKLSAPADRFALWKAARAIQNELEDLGHPHADVRVLLENVGPATVRARFEIEDGPHIPVDRVEFTGNRAFSEDKLRHEMRRVAPGAHFAELRHKNICTKERLDDDRGRLADYYRNHGYPEVRVGEPAVEIRRDVKQRWFPWPRPRTVPRFHISVPVSEGAFYRLSAVDIQSDRSTAGPSNRVDALLATPGLQPGAPYSQQELEALREAAAQLPSPGPSKNRSVASDVTMSQEFDPAERTALITLRIHPQNPYVLRRLEFTGERRFSDRYYRRHIPLQEGEPFDPKKLELGLEHLSRTGYVRPVKKEDIHAQFDEAHHTVDVAIRISEIGQQKISLSGGRSNLGNSIGLAYNVFNLLGGEELISSQIEGTPDSLRVALTITEEGVFGTRASLAFSVFQNFLRPNLPLILGHRHLFKSRSSGLATDWIYPVGQTETLTTTYTLSHQSTQYSLALPPDLTGVLPNRIGSSTSGHSLGLKWDAVAGPQHWDTGASVSGGWLGGNENLARSSFEYDRQQPDPLTNGRNCWAFRGYAAGVSSFRGDLLFQERYFIGSGLLRGFRDGELAPYAVVESTGASGKDSFRTVPAGSNLQAAVNAEYRVPVAPRTRAVGFFDTGSGWLLPNWLGPERPVLLNGTNGLLRASTGVELRWQTPLVQQPLRVDFAVNPLRLAKSFLLPDGSHFRASDRRAAMSWALGSLF